jgi:hypothetical protein
MKFNRTYANWPLHDREHLNITEVETEGKDLEDFLANARIYIETWHGGEGPDYSIEDLHPKDYEALVMEFTEHLNTGRIYVR